MVHKREGSGNKGRESGCSCQLGGGGGHVFPLISTARKAWKGHPLSPQMADIHLASLCPGKSGPDCFVGAPQRSPAVGLAHNSSVAKPALSREPYTGGIPLLGPILRRECGGSWWQWHLWGQPSPCRHKSGKAEPRAGGGVLEQAQRSDWQLLPSSWSLSMAGL